MHAIVNVLLPYCYLLPIWIDVKVIYVNICKYKSISIEGIKGTVA
jgi:hypothetical protein